MKALIIIPLSFFMLASCANRRGTINEVKDHKVLKTITIREEVKDTTVIVPEEKSTFKGDLKVLENGTIILSNTDMKNGKSLKAPNVRILNNKITVDCEKEAQALFFTWKNQYIDSNTVETLTTSKTIEVPRKLKTWQLFLMWTGALSLLVLVINIVAFIFKIKLVNPFKK